MLVIRVAMNLKPENKSQFIDFMKESITISRQFDGCVRYDIYEHIADANCFILYEEWESQTTFEGYKASDHFKTSTDVLIPMLGTPPDSAYYTASLIQ